MLGAGVAGVVGVFGEICSNCDSVASMCEAASEGFLVGEERLDHHKDNPGVSFSYVKVREVISFHGLTAVQGLSYDFLRQVVWKC